MTPKQQRTAEMVAMYKSGLTLAGIGAHYGITRERVRQILKKNGIVRADGGISKRVEQKKAASRKKSDAASFARFGLTWGERKAIPATARAA